MAKQRQLSNLESTALGIIWKHGGCTAYEVMAEFSGSLTAQFKTRAGSVYPLVGRLHTDGLIRKKNARRGQQKKSEYTITAAGRRALANWITPPILEPDLSLHPDPIRSRVYFLGILPQSNRLAFLEHAHSQLMAELSKVKTSLKEFQEANNKFGVLAMNGAVRVTKARIAWIAEVLKKVSDEDFAG